MRVQWSWKQTLSAVAAAMMVALASGGAAAGAAQQGQGKPDGKSQGKPAAAAARKTPGPMVTVYKTPTCGCCKLWVDHLKAHGYRVTERDTADVAPIKAMLGVPRQLGTCHTAVVGGYVVEGHVPADVIARLLRERPRVTGIAVPGMPLGSPGMEVPGRAPERYDILSFDRQGKVAVYAKK